MFFSGRNVEHVQPPLITILYIDSPILNESGLFTISPPVTRVCDAHHAGLLYSVYKRSFVAKKDETQSSRKLITSFFEDGELLNVDKNQVVYDSGAQSRSIFYVKTGFIKSYTITSDGEFNILSFYGPGSVFPLAPVLRKRTNIKPFDITGDVYFESMDEVSVRKRDSAEFHDLIKNNPVAYEELIYQLLRNYSIYSSRVGSQQFKHASNRVVYQLLMLATRFGEEIQEGVIISVPLTHQDISDSLAMARETVTREIEQLRKKGYIETKDRHLIIHDMEAMRALLQLS